MAAHCTVYRDEPGQLGLGLVVAGEAVLLLTHCDPRRPNRLLRRPLPPGLRVPDAWMRPMPGGARLEPVPLVPLHEVDWMPQPHLVAMGAAECVLAWSEHCAHVVLARPRSQPRLVVWLDSPARAAAAGIVATRAHLYCVSGEQVSLPSHVGVVLVIVPMVAGDGMLALIAASTGEEESATHIACLVRPVQRYMGRGDTDWVVTWVCITLKRPMCYLCVPREPHWRLNILPTSLMVPILIIMLLQSWNWRRA